LEEIAREHQISKTTLKHVKNFLSGVFRHAAQQGYFDGSNPVKLAEIPAFAPNGMETKPYSIEEIVAMLKVLPELPATAVATAAFTGLRLGELRGLTWESYEPAQDQDSLGWLNVTRSVWRTTVGDPKTTVQGARARDSPTGSEIGGAQKTLRRSEDWPNLQQLSRTPSRSECLLSETDEGSS